MKKKLLFPVILFMSIMILSVITIDARTIMVNIDHVEYCDLDADGKEDDVYAEVYLKMWEGTNYLTFQATLRFHGEILYTIYRDNHIRTESEIIYRFFFYNVAYSSGWYILSVWFIIENDDNIAFLKDVAVFDPPGGDPDYPPGGGVTPGP